MAHSPNSFAALSNAGRRTARFRAIQYAEQLLSSREGRTEDLISVISRLGLMDQLFGCRDMWVLRMPWER
eukprot:3147854-Pleurochrysis_carterae.AAC.1